MTAEHIRKLLAAGEGLTVEFKECANELNNAVFETVCSFSNRYGGHLLLGVRDDGEIVGVNPAAVGRMRKNFVNMLNNPQKTSPSLYLNLEEAELDGRTLLHAYIPVSSQIQSCSGRIYDRNEDGDFDITNATDLVAHLAVRKSSQFTERKVFPYAKEEHLLLDRLMPLVRNMAADRTPKHPWRNMSDMEILRSAGLYEEDVETGRRGFNRAAILLFGREEVIQQVAPGYVTDCLLRVDNRDRYDDRLRVETNLIESFDALMDFIAKHTNDPFFLIDNLNVSVRGHIAKEIVSNILVHREFSGTCPARIIIERDRLIAENWNRALRHGRINPESFEPYPKNPILARFFVNIGYADTLGSGVRNLIKYTRLYSGGEPELIEGEIFRTIIPLGANAIAGNAQPEAAERVTEREPEVAEIGLEVAERQTKSEQKVAEMHSKSNQMVTERAPEVAEGVTEIAPEVTEKVTESEAEVFALISRDGAMTQDEMAARLGVSRKTVYLRVRGLKAKGLIRRVGSDTKGHWEVRDGGCIRKG